MPEGKEKEIRIRVGFFCTFSRKCTHRVYDLNSQEPKGNDRIVDVGEGLQIISVPMQILNHISGQDVTRPLHEWGEFVHEILVSGGVVLVGWFSPRLGFVQSRTHVDSLLVLHPSKNREHAVGLEENIIIRFCPEGEFDIAE